jgi:hypothetical protein
MPIQVLCRTRDLHRTRLTCSSTQSLYQRLRLIRLGSRPSGLNWRACRTPNWLSTSVSVSKKCSAEWRRVGGNDRSWKQRHDKPVCPPSTPSPVLHARTSPQGPARSRLRCRRTTQGGAGGAAGSFAGDVAAALSCETTFSRSGRRSSLRAASISLIWRTTMAIHSLSWMMAAFSCGGRDRPSKT